MVQMLRIRDVCRLLCISRSQVRRLIADSGFPAPIKLGKRVAVWLQAEIEEWQRAQIALSRRDN